MARKRMKHYDVGCPVCGGSHKTYEGHVLYRAKAVWNGFVTNMFCDVIGMHFYKLYDEEYHYVCWQQTTTAVIPDHDEMPF